MELSKEIEAAVEAALVAVESAKNNNDNLSYGLQREQNLFTIEVHTSIKQSNGESTKVTLKLPVSAR